MSLSCVTGFPTLRKRLGIALVLAGLLLLPGCWVTSIHGLYDDEFFTSKDPDLAFDPGLIGSWTKIGDKCSGPLTITAKDGVYNLQSKDASEDCADSGKSRVQAHLVKLDTYYFLDVSPIEDEVCAMCLAKHTIFLVRLDKTTLSLTPLDSDWLKKSLEAKTITLATMPDDSDTLIASTKELKAFCRRYAGDKEAFKPDSKDTSTFTRK